MGPFYFAWVAQGTEWDPVTLRREDEKVFAFELTHTENNFPTLVLTVRNPHIGLLASGRLQWMWFSWDALDGELTPLFYGQLFKVPDQLQGETVQLTFIARPADYLEQKETLAETLRVLPYYDPIWFTEEARTDPDTVLEGRTAYWHIDRLTHRVTISDILSGEDGAVIFSSDDFFYDSLSITYDQVPLRKVHVEGQVRWPQTGTGNVDISQQVRNAFVAAGSESNQTASSFTGDGLVTDWPHPGDNIGGGWFFGEGTQARIIGTAQRITCNWSRVLGSTTTYYQCVFDLSLIEASVFVTYSATRDRTETVIFDLVADVQGIESQAGEQEIIDLKLTSDSVGEGIDESGAIPIGDLRRPSYFKIARGQQSITNLLLMAGARLMLRARAISVEIQTSWQNALLLSCRMDAIILDDRLPGGQAQGKITSYKFSGDGSNGQFMATITIACAIGKGGTVSPSLGTPTYVDEGYVEPYVYQAYAGSTTGVLDQVTFENFDDLALTDDGLDLFNMTPTSVIQSVIITHGVTEQRAAIMNSPYIADPPNALRDLFTEIELHLMPLQGSFAFEIPLTVSELMVPQSIDLEAG